MNVSAGACKKHLEKSKNESDRVVSMMKMVRCEHYSVAHVLILVVATQNGSEVCKITCSSSVSMLQLKAKVAVEAGCLEAIHTIYLLNGQPLGESVTLADCDILSGCGRVKELYMIKLSKVVIADMVGVSPHELTDAQLAKVCATDVGDIIVLKGCRRLHGVSCLIGLEQMCELDISGCDSIDPTLVAKVIAPHK
jgi:hypothetical protein